MTTPDKLISSILKHDNKQNSYKIALLRAINDVVLAYPDMLARAQDVAIPLRVLARYWFAYYWSFNDPCNPIYQGARAMRGGSLTNDMAFRPQLTELCEEWTKFNGTSSPADGYILTSDILLPRKQQHMAAQAPMLLQAYARTVRAVMQAIEQPIRYAGTNLEGQFSVFRPLPRYGDELHLSAIPGTEPNDRCIVVPVAMWEAFGELSLWIEALCVHEWALFIKDVTQADHHAIRPGDVFELLIARPDNRMTLDWERLRINMLLADGVQFTCVWSHLPIGPDYQLDHLIPVAVYPMNEMWNLIPTHPAANNKKRDLIPSAHLLERAVQRLVRTYQYYQQDTVLNSVLQEDSIVRFSTLNTQNAPFDHVLAQRVVNFMEYIAQSRNLARVEAF